MKKVITLLVLFLISPIIVLADKPKVLTLDAENNNNVITFSGTTESGSVAAMCKLLDDEDHEIDILSVKVDEEEFEGTFTAPETGDYTVACANYDGGEIKKSEVISIENVTTYIVRFLDGENEITHVSVDAGGKVTRPEDPEKNGFTFIGWYADDTFNLEFDFDDTIDGPTTIYAKFEEIQVQPPVTTVALHTIYLGEGGTYSVDFATDDPDNQGPMDAQINQSGAYFVVTNGEVTLTAVADEGYVFAGWYEVEEQNGNEWVQIRKLSDDATYIFNIEDNLYVAPVFEDHRIFPVHFNTTGGEPIEDRNVQSGDFIIDPPTPEKDGYTFVHWCADDTLNIEFDFNEPITGEVTLYAKWDENEPDPNTGGEEPNQPEPEKDTPYTATDGQNTIDFLEEEGHAFSLVVIDIMELTDAELLEFSEGEINREAYEAMEAALKEALEDKGEVLSVYQILLLDEHNNEIEQGPFNIKLAMTPEMEDFDTFKLLYVDFDNNFDIEETIELSAANGFLTGTLQHLSNYVLVGTKTGTNTNGGTTNTTETPTTNNNEATTTETPKAEEKATETTKTNNPKTLDNIYIWVIILVISIVGIFYGMFKTKKVFK